MKNTLIIICGVPGSGKSTLAEALIKNGTAQEHYEADMFMMENGEYKFDFKKLGYAHKSCQDATRRALRDGKSVVVSNTSVRPSDRKIYIQMAKEFDANIQLIQVTGTFESIHNVPVDTILKMCEDLERNWNPSEEIK